MLPLVSVVMPSFQQGRFLRAAVDSVLSQDHPRVELLVMDGGSTDGSLEILRSYGDRLWFRSGSDGGQTAAINEGMRRARGDIVAWLNSDDLYRAGAIRAAVEALADRPDAALVYGEGDLVDAAGNVLRRFPETVPFDLWRLANVADYILQPTVFMRRRAFEQVGGIDERWRWGFDWDLWLRMGSVSPLHHVPRTLAASRLHDETKTATGGFARLRELDRILRSHGVSRRSPAVWAHAITTMVRCVHPGHDPVSAQSMRRRWPRWVGAAVGPFAERAELALRRWLENAQGVWSDGLVARRARLWLPAGRTALVGRNLDLDGQVVRATTADGTVATSPLRAGESFELALPPGTGSQRIAVRMQCSRTCRVPAIRREFGARRAGYELHA